MPNPNVRKLPSEVIEVMQESDIAYLSVTSPKGNLYIYPIAFYFSGHNIYFSTPVSSAKYRFIKANPKVSLVVDNRKLTTDACGAMVQGDATIFSVRHLFSSIISLMSTAMHLSKKYPGLFSFYAKGKELPNERKFYKYRFIRINPTKVLYWVGYKFGRYTPKNAPKRLRRLFADLKTNQKKRESALEAMAEMLESQDEMSMPEEPTLLDEPWVRRLNQAASTGGVSEEERRILQLFAESSPFSAAKSARKQLNSKVSDDEKSILKKWRESRPRE